MRKKRLIYVTTKPRSIYFLIKEGSIIYILKSLYNSKPKSLQMSHSTSPEMLHIPYKSWIYKRWACIINFQNTVSLTIPFS